MRVVLAATVTAGAPAFGGRSDAVHPEDVGQAARRVGDAVDGATNVERHEMERVSRRAARVLANTQSIRSVRCPPRVRPQGLTLRATCKIQLSDGTRIVVPVRIVPGAGVI